MMLTEVLYAGQIQPGDRTIVWDVDTVVGALPASAQLKFVCQGCGRRRSEVTRYLVGQGRFGGLTLKKLEDVIPCSNPCCGSVATIATSPEKPDAEDLPIPAAWRLRFAS